MGKGQMTYCVAIALNEGLIFASDSRTSAGLDHISTYKKMHPFVWEGDRVLILLSAGNLATTQAVVRKLEYEIIPDEHSRTNLRSVAYVSEAAEHVGRISRAIQHDLCDAQQSNFHPTATFILGGQIGIHPPELYLIYPEGNFISMSPEHPFLQIGETKYGKPILDRIVTSATSLEDAARCALVSLDSTMRSNLSVGPPVDLVIYEKNALKLACEMRLELDHPYMKQMRIHWNDGLKKLFGELPRLNWSACR